MIKYVKGDLFDNIADDQLNVICHVCNDEGVMGSGFVIPLSKHFPLAKSEYELWHIKGDRYIMESMCGDICQEHIFLAENSCFQQGNVQVVYADDNVEVCNMIAQDLYKSKRPLNYYSLARCMKKVSNRYKDTDFRIICPMFGSALAGGNWEFIECLINDIWIKDGLDVTIYHLEDRNG